MVFGGLNQPHHAAMKSRLLSTTELHNMNKVTKCQNTEHCTNECEEFTEQKDCNPGIFKRMCGIMKRRDKNGVDHHLTEKAHHAKKKASGGYTHFSVTVTAQEENVQYTVLVYYDLSTCTSAGTTDDGNYICVVHTGTDGSGSGGNGNGNNSFDNNYYYDQNGADDGYYGGYNNNPNYGVEEYICIIDDGDDTTEYQQVNCEEVGVDVSDTDAEDVDWEVVDTELGDGTEEHEYIKTEPVVTRDATALAVGLSVAAVGVVGVVGVVKYREKVRGGGGGGMRRGTARTTSLLVRS